MPAIAASQAEAARLIAFGRIALGATYTLVPSIALAAWPGRGCRRSPVVRLLARSVGVRDLALGVGTLAALRHESPVRGWLEAGVLADAGDALAIVLGFRHLPRARAVMGLLSAAGGAASGRWLVRQMAQAAAGAQAAGRESA